MIGIIPAAGHATRLMGLPKMLLPIPGGTLIGVLCDRMIPGDGDETKRIAIGCNGMVREMLSRWAVLSPDKLTYDAVTQTMSETVLLAQPYARVGEAVQFGMPDTYFEDKRAFIKLGDALASGADVAVGVFLARPGQHREGGMCMVRGGRVTSVVDKPEISGYPYIWGVLAWQPSFWQFIDAADPHVGYALPKAINAGLNVRAVLMDGGFWDCGTPDRYFDLIVHLRAESLFAHAS